MDIAKVHAHMDECKRVVNSGNRMTPGGRKVYDEIRAAKKLDRLDASVLVKSLVADEVLDWEHYDGINDYRTEGGELSILISGVDADGEHGVGRVVAYPAGRWLKFESVLTTVDNPYYVDPDQPDPDDVPPNGF